MLKVNKITLLKTYYICFYSISDKVRLWYTGTRVSCLFYACFLAERLKGGNKFATASWGSVGHHSPRDRKDKASFNVWGGGGIFLKLAGNLARKSSKIP
jgi:hypothetical protein